jgi:hypothetical protein
MLKYHFCKHISQERIDQAFLGTPLVGLDAYLWVTNFQLSTLSSISHTIFHTNRSSLLQPRIPQPLLQCRRFQVHLLRWLMSQHPRSRSLLCRGPPGLSPEAKLEALAINAVNRNGPYIGIVVPNPYEIVVSLLLPALLVSRPRGSTRKPAAKAAKFLALFGVKSRVQQRLCLAPSIVRCCLQTWAFNILESWVQRS